MKPCLYCGNNTIPHQTHKFFESFDILVSPIRRGLLQTWFGTVTDQLAEWVGLGLFHILHTIGLIAVNRDIEKIPYDRAKMLWTEALSRHIEIEELKPFNRSIDLYRARLPSLRPSAIGFASGECRAGSGVSGQAKLKGHWHYFMNLPRREKVTTSNLTWIDDKYLLKKKLLQHNFPVAPGGSFTGLNPALKTFETLAKPVIVKPRAGSRGRHTTTLVYTQDDFIQAFKIAKQLCHWVVVEEHLFGDVQRATIIGGKLIGVLGGSSPRVTGDGIHTIAELIKTKDTTRPAKVKEIKVNPYFMQRNNLNLDTILPSNKTVDLSEKIGVNYGGTSYDCTDETHPETKQMLEQAGRMLDISILGFDFIIPDVTKSYQQQKCGIIECNGAPFIQLHHEPLYGQSINTAKYVWDLVM